MYGGPDVQITPTVTQCRSIFKITAIIKKSKTNNKETLHFKNQRQNSSNHKHNKKCNEIKMKR